MVGNRGDKKRRDAWERLGWVWTALFYTLLLLTSTLALSRGNLSGQERWLVIGLTLFLALWYVAPLWLGRDWLYAQWKLSFLLMAAGVAAWYALVVVDDTFYYLLAGLFPAIFIYQRIPLAIALGVVVATLALLEQAGGAITIGSPLLWIYLSGVGAMTLLGVWINAIIGQSVRRRALIEQLETTRAELAAAERREGALQERARLAREIHDTLSQGFTSIVMHLEAAEQALPDDMETLRRHLDRARQTARDNLRQAREVVQDLRPELLALQSLPEAIARIGARWAEANEVAVSTTVTGTVTPLPPAVDVTLLRAVQEALVNVGKYARAQTVTVTLSYMGDVVVLDVQDDGVGLAGAEPSPFSGGFGLRAMRERVEELGGVLVLESAPEEGTTLMIEIPLNGSA